MGKHWETGLWLWLGALGQREGRKHVDGGVSWLMGPVTLTSMFLT